MGGQRGLCRRRRGGAASSSSFFKLFPTPAGRRSPPSGRSAVRPRRRRLQRKFTATRSRERRGPRRAEGIPPPPVACSELRGAGRIGSARSTAAEPHRRRQEGSGEAFRALHTEPFPMPGRGRLSSGRVGAFPPCLTAPPCSAPRQERPEPTLPHLCGCAPPHHPRHGGALRGRDVSVRLSAHRAARPQWIRATAAAALSEAGREGGRVWPEELRVAEPSGLGKAEVGERSVWES